MKSKTYIRYFVMLIVLATILMLYSLSGHLKKDSCSYGEGDQKQSEFVFLRSISHIFLSSQE